MVLEVKNPPANARDVRDVSSIPGSGRSPGEGCDFIRRERSAVKGGEWQVVKLKSCRVVQGWGTCDLAGLTKSWDFILSINTSQTFLAKDPFLFLKFLFYQSPIKYICETQ